MHRRFVPSVLLALACALLIGAAAPAAGALSRDAQTRQNLRLLQVYVERSAAGRGFAYPAVSVVKKGGLTAPVWPTNPWTGRPMAPGTARGAYTYTLAAGGGSYTLRGRLSSGSLTLTGRAPSWLADERAAAAADLHGAQTAAAAARGQAAELGGRVIKGYVEQYGMLNNAWPPRWEDVRPHGDLGALFGYWPDNPYTGEPMAPGVEPGCFDYSEHPAGAYELRVRRSPTSWIDLSGTVPQQLKNALNASRDERVKADMYYLQGAVDRYAVANNLLFPATVDKVTLSEWAVDYWPSHPWLAGTDMGPGTDAGSYTYSPGGPNGYTLSGHLSDGTDYTVDGSGQNGSEASETTSRTCACRRTDRCCGSTSRSGRPPTEARRRRWT